MFPIGDDNRDRLHRPVVTYLLIAANVAVFLYMLTLRGRGADLFVYRRSVIPAVFSTRRTFSRPTRRSTRHSCTDPLHRDVSSRWLAAYRREYAVSLGLWGQCRGCDGAGTLPHFLSPLGLAGNFAHIYFNRDSLAPSIGASGAIAGVLGGYIVLRPRGKVRNVIWLGIIFIPLTYRHGL